MNRFIEYLELDLSLEIFIFKKTDKEIISTVKVNNKEVKELKIKKESILFTTFDETDENDFIIEIYPTNNQLITLSYKLKDEYVKDENIKNEFEKFKEYIKSLIL